MNREKNLRIGLSEVDICPSEKLIHFFPFFQAAFILANNARATNGQTKKRALEAEMIRLTTMVEMVNTDLRNEQAELTRALLKGGRDVTDHAMRTAALRAQINNDAAIITEMATTIAAHAGVVAQLRLENQRNLAELVRLRGAPVTPAKTIVDEPVFPLVSPNIRPFEHASPPSPMSPSYCPSRSISFNLAHLPVATPLPLPVLDFESDSESEN